MSDERIFAYDQVSVDVSKIEEYEHPLHGPTTVFKDVVIAREIVQPYKDGNAYKPANELKDAFWTADGMWAIAIGHPDTAVIMDRDQMHGRTVNPRYSKSLKDPKTKRPNNKGIVVDLEVFNNKVTPEVLADMKAGKRHDVSIGFFFNKDEAPGVIEEDGHPLKGLAYDYVQRKMAINHTAFALEAGRCPMPFCGIGADEIKMHIAGDPFGEYKNFAECVAKNQDKEDPEAYCGSIKAKVEEKKDVFKTVLENLRKEIDTVLSNFDDVEEDAGTPKTEAERAMAHFNISEEKWAAMSAEEKAAKIKELPPRGQGLKGDEGETIVDDVMSDEDLSGLLAFYTLTKENWDTLLDETRIVLRSLWTERSKEYLNTDPLKMAGGEQPLDVPALTGDEDSSDECLDCDEDEENVGEGEVAAGESQEEKPVDDIKPVDVPKKPFVATKTVEELLRRQE